MIGTTYSGGAFKFDPATRTLTTSGSTIFQDGGVDYSGPIIFELCLGGNTDCADFTLTYARNLCASATFSLNNAATGSSTFLLADGYDY